VTPGASTEDVAEGAPQAAPSAPDASVAGPPPRATVADAITDFVQMIVDYVRQETGDVVHDKVVLPTQQAGQVVAFALAAAGVFVMGALFISVAVLLVLADLMGWPAALLLVGGVLMLGAAILTYIKIRRIQP